MVDINWRDLYNDLAQEKPNTVLQFRMNSEELIDFGLALDDAEIKAVINSKETSIPEFDENEISTLLMELMGDASTKAEMENIKAVYVKSVEEKSQFIVDSEDALSEIIADKNWESKMIATKQGKPVTDNTFEIKPEYIKNIIKLHPDLINELP